MKKLISFLKQPSSWFLALVILLAAGAVTASLVLVALEMHGWYSYIVYALAALFFAYGIYLIAVCAKKIKRDVLAWLKKFRFTRRLVEDFGFRTMVFSAMSFLLNVGFAVFEGILAIIGHSVWYGALAIYYLVLSVMRFCVVIFGAKTPKEDIDKRNKIYLASGAALFVLTLALSAAVVQMVLYDKAFRYAGVMIYAAAAYAFIKITLAVRNLAKARKYDDTVVQSLRNINFATALVSMLGLQTALISAFSEGGDMRYMNAVTGGAVCFIIAGMGLFMVVKAILSAKEKEDGRQ